ncbi:MAG: hypothetical protein WAZ34_03130 [Rhodocyclaceae bacterium]
MKIDESSVVLRGKRSFESECTTEASFKCSFRAVYDSVAEAAEVAPAGGRPLEQGEKVRLMLQKLIAEVIALISGQAACQVVDVRSVLGADGAAPDGPARAPRGTEFSWENVMVETVRERESSEFSASGVIRTADGRSIDFQLDLAMCRSYQCERKEVDRGTVKLRDPLVINFDGKACELADGRFDFDLDSDGRQESMHALAGGSAFLALDRNNDGRINDGSELFGAASGNGFADLALLDDDGNGWLDEADAAFASLRAWSRDVDGKEAMSSLQESGVGALYLGSNETPFSLKDDDNRLRGQVRSSGVYLREDGRAGSLQQIDLAV